MCNLSYTLKFNLRKFAEIKRAILRIFKFNLRKFAEIKRAILRIFKFNLRKFAEIKRAILRIFKFNLRKYAEIKRTILRKKILNRYFLWSYFLKNYKILHANFWQDLAKWQENLGLLIFFHLIFLFFSKKYHYIHNILHRVQLG